MSSTRPTPSSAPSGLRAAVERVSRPVLVSLTSLPRLVPFLAVLALLLAGALVPGWGYLLTALVVLFLAWVLYLAWPRLTGSERIMRVAVVVLLAAIVVVQANPRT